jgi:hypothetical protein
LEEIEALRADLGLAAIHYRVRGGAHQVAVNDSSPLCWSHGATFADALCNAIEAERAAREMSLRARAGE